MSSLFHALSIGIGWQQKKHQNKQLQFLFLYCLTLFVVETYSSSSSAFMFKTQGLEDSAQNPCMADLPVLALDSETWQKTSI